MSLDVAIKVSPRRVSTARLDTTTRILLHHDGHYQVLERSLRDFRHLERQLHAEIAAATTMSLSTSISHSIDAFCDAKRSIYPFYQLCIRLAMALETFLNHVVANFAVLATSRAVKLFLGGNEWTRDETRARRYRDAVEICIGQANREELLETRVAAGCSMEHHETVRGAGAEEKRVVLWKFLSQGAGVMFYAEFSSAIETTSTAHDPYSISSNDVVESQVDKKEVAYYRTHYTFEGDEKKFVYGHFVAEKNGVLMLQWENRDTSSVMSKPLQFCVAMVPLSAASEVLETADACNSVGTLEWLFSYIHTSSTTSVADLIGWGDDECEESAFGEDSAYEECTKDRDADLKLRVQFALLEERNRELEARVIRLETSLAATKKEFKSAADRAHIAEEIYKANLETIAQLERATTGGTVPKSLKVAASPSDEPLASAGAPIKQTSSSELERMQNLCAGFQEQCLWRSMENMELEAHLAASQVEASSWRKSHSEQAVQLEEFKKQIDTLRAHKKLLVHEVKRLQPFSHVNVAALVHEAEEARMVQRSLQSKLDLHERVSTATALVSGEASSGGP